MLRVQCPTCGLTVQVHDEQAGQKVTCPKCYQRLQIPIPPAPTAPPSIHKTVYAPLITDPESPPASGPVPVGSPAGLPPSTPRARVADPGVVVLTSSTSSRPPPLPEEPANPFAALDRRSESADDGPIKTDRYEPPTKHSGLGIASFLIALLVGGLDCILMFVIAVGIAKSTHRNQLADNVVSGSAAMLCLNAMSIPLCLVGVGLAVVGLVAHRESNQLFTWIGLMGNTAIILGVMGVYVLAVMASH